MRKVDITISDADTGAIVHTIVNLKDCFLAGRTNHGIKWAVFNDVKQRASLNKMIDQAITELRSVQTKTKRGKK